MRGTFVLFLLAILFVSGVQAQTNECGTEEGCACKTKKSARVILPSDVITDLQSGDVITARYGTLCVGQVEYTQGKALNLTVWGENTLTGDPGIPEGAVIEYSVVRQGSGTFTDDVAVQYATGDGTFTTGSISQVSPFMVGGTLPVELAAFEALVDGEDVVLTRKTISETNNAGFWVERSAGDDSVYVPVTFVPGQGSASQAPTYRHRVEGLPSGRHRF
ncbi:MAG: hypothetical protein D6746_13615, partial [Bacteroidetes bacterium]